MVCILNSIAYFLCSQQQQQKYLEQNEILDKTLKKIFD